MGSGPSMVAIVICAQTFALAWVPEETTCSVTQRIVESNVSSHRAQRLQNVVSLLNSTWQLGDPKELEFELNEQTFVIISQFANLQLANLAKQ